MNQGALANLDDNAIVERIAKGEYQSHIAQQLGVAPQSLHERISKHPHYRAALASRNGAKLDQAQSRLEGAPDLARASMAAQEFKAASWRAERECPAEWGQRSQVTLELGPELAGALAEARERTRSLTNAAPQKKDVSEKAILAEFTQVADK